MLVAGERGSGKINDDKRRIKCASFLRPKVVFYNLTLVGLASPKA